MPKFLPYAFESLREDAGLVLYRARSLAAPSQILVVAPVSEQPAQSALRRLEHEYAFRSELDAAWAALPLALEHNSGRMMLVLQNVCGESLDRVIERPLALMRFLRIAVGVSAVLAEVHRRGIIHQDIKPANILVDPTSEQVWLTGFAFAAHLPRGRQVPDTPETIGGTLAYMAPEQTGRMNRSIDSRSDLYSLGVTFYEMLTGALPFTALDPLEWVHCHIARQPTPPRERARELPEALSAIVLKLLAKTPEERYQTAAGLEADLRRCLRDSESLGHIGSFPLGSHDIPDRLVISEKLYGRERESEALLEAFDRVVTRGTPELVLVSGYSGIGKSSVVNELHRAIVLPRGIFISGKFDQYKRDIPYATLAQAFQTLVRQILSKSEGELERWRVAISDAVSPNGQLIVDLIPELELIIGKQTPVVELPPQEAGHRFQTVFRAFLAVFARKEHPLVLFLDDLQWLDIGTLNLLENLATHPDVRHLLLIGAFRDNEISLSHPLTLTLDSIRKTGATTVRDIVLAPLSLDDVGQLVADSLHQDPTRTAPLAVLVHQKTAGNPFFMIQFLAALAEERLVEFDPHEAVWHWDVDRIRAGRITDNVVDLIVAKLNRLPDVSREALKQLACLGNNAETAILTIVHEGSEAEMHMALRGAVREGFVVRLDGSYKFVHDRVQEAAYCLIPEEDRVKVHLRIGRLLTARVPADEVDNKVFDIVNQLNRGAILISDPVEKRRVAELNLRAGRKAKASMACTAACTYLSVGMALLDREDWESLYELTFSLWLLRAECELLCGNFDQAERFISELLQRAASKVDKAAVHRLQIDLNIMRAAHEKAIDSALECLRLFDIEMSAHPTWEQVQAEYQKIWRNLGERSIESLINIPLVNDPEIQAVTRTLSVLALAILTDTNLFYLSTCRIVNLSLIHGATDASAHGYARFGGILGPVFHRYDEGRRFGKLGVDLVEKHGFVAFKTRVFLNMAWAAIWTRPVTTALEFILTALRSGLESGALVYTCYCYNYLVAYLLLRGDHLDEIWRESERSLDFARKAKFSDAADCTIAQQLFVRCIREETAARSSFSDALLEDAAFEAQLPKNSILVCFYWILKLQARFITGDYEAALAAAHNAKALLWAAASHVQLLDYHYYAALTITALFDRARPERQLEWRETLSAHIEQLREWADNYPPTFRDKHMLVSAEIARVEGRDLDAMRLYEQALRSARENGFVNNEAITNEVAGRFYLNRGIETIGRTYLRNARSCYLRWGARGKVRQLDQLYPGLEAQMPIGPTATIGSSMEQLDLTTVVRALQAVSREIDLEKLIETLMANALEHAGAQRSLLFLRRGPEHQVEAEATTVGDKVDVVLAQAFAALPKFPESVLLYVIRKRESIILDDASAENQFSDDAYMQATHLRSILCLPLINGGELTGVLYLENNLAPRVFTADRLAVVELLASQAAISLKNARLYTDLKQENSERRKAEEDLRQSTAELSHLREEVRYVSRTAMMGELTASLAHELNQPLGAILSNAQAVRRFLGEKKPDLAEVKTAVEEIIHDNSRAVETIRNVRTLFQRGEAQMSAVDLKQVVLDVERILTADAVFKNISLQLDLPASLPTIIGSRTQLIQALMNLVLNAFDSVCEGGDGPREVTIWVKKDETGQALVAVRDSGKGIEPEIMPRLFEAFFTTKPNGMGMGLAITRSVIENHGGRLWATSNADRGATLHFTLPIVGGRDTN